MVHNAAPAPDTTEDLFFAGQVRLLQPAKGHRSGTDAVLLAAACPPTSGVIVDLGAGAGLVGLRAAQMNSASHVILIENDVATAALARKNIEGNGLGARVELREDDALAAGFALAREGTALKAACLLTNPPFFASGTSRVSPVAQRAASHVLRGSLEDWVKAMRRLVEEGGEIVMIHRADALAAILQAFGKRFGAVRILPVHPRADQPASRVLIRARAGAKSPLQLDPPLILHTKQGAFTAQADALHRGERLFQY